MLAAKDGVRRTCRGDDDVGAVAGVVEIVELDGLAVELLRQTDGPFVSAVGDEDRRATMRHQVAGGEFAHLAGAHDEYRLPFQRPENLLSQFHRDRRDRHRRRSHCRLAAHALGYGEGAAEKLVKLAADGSHGPGRRVSFLHLAQNLRFAHDHRIQTRSHAEHMPHRVFLRGIRKDAHPARPAVR